MKTNTTQEGLSGTLGPTAKSAVELKLPHRIRILEEMIIAQADHILTLQERLSPLIGHVPAAVASDDAVACDDNICPLAGHIGDLSSTIAENNSKIRGILDNLQI